MKKKDVRTAEITDELTTDVAVYLELKSKADALAKELEALKEKITAQANGRFAEFSEAGELILSSGKIKVALNPHKMVFEASGKTVDPSTRASISLLLPEAYRTWDLNVKLINDRMTSDKILARGLKSAGVVVVQETRFDIKPNK